MSEEMTVEPGGGNGATGKVPPWALSSTKWHERHSDAKQFIKEVQRFDRGRLAALRSNAGNTLGEARGVPWIYYHLQSRPNYLQERYFLVATIVDLNRRKAEEEDLGATLRLVRKNSSDSFERRFKVLLDAQFDLAPDGQFGPTPGGGELAYRLEQMVRLAASRECGIDWAILLADLCYWNWDGKPIQKKWARNYYAPELNTALNDSVSADQGDTNVN